MKSLNKTSSKILPPDDLKVTIKKWRKAGCKIVFTNGCFDILHRGHIELLEHAANLGDKLIIGLNSDSSVKEIKGPNRPIIDEKSRAISLASLIFSDAIILFYENTPENLIKSIMPDILAKGGDYKTSNVIGADIVKNNGGEVVLLPFITGFSTTKIIDKIKKT